MTKVNRRPDPNPLPQTLELLDDGLGHLRVDTIHQALHEQGGPIMFVDLRIAGVLPLIGVSI